MKKVDSVGLDTRRNGPYEHYVELRFSIHIETGVNQVTVLLNGPIRKFYESKSVVPSVNVSPPSDTIL